jgi:hypothetical protein
LYDRYIPLSGLYYSYSLEPLYSTLPLNGLYDRYSIEHLYSTLPLNGLYDRAKILKSNLMVIGHYNIDFTSRARIY